MRAFVEENTFTFLSPSRARAVSIAGAVTPVSELGRQVHAKLAEASDHLRNEEFALALGSYRELAAQLVNLVDPDVPLRVWTAPGFAPPRTPAILTALADAAGRLLATTPPPASDLPSVVRPPAVSPDVKAATEPFAKAGVSSTDQAALGKAVSDAARAAQARRWDDAERLYASAIELADAAKDVALREDLEHDLELVRGEAGRRPPRPAPAGPGSPAAPVISGPRIAPIAPIAVIAPSLGRVVDRGGLALSAAAARVEIPRADALPLRAGARIESRAQADRFTLLGAADRLAIDVPAAGAASPGAAITELLERRQISSDLGVLDGYTQTPEAATAFLPHVYFFVIPMGIGDAQLGLGAFLSAQAQYVDASQYRYLAPLERFKVWSRLAELFLARGDREYRRAGNDPAGWAAAAALYGRIVRADATVDPASPLYAGALAALRPRVEAAAAATDPAAHADNPALIAIVQDALSRLTQIAAGLNFLGFAPDAVPPFTFEYLQNTARYFAQQASRLEQLYVSFKSRAEAEALSRDQIAQQAEIAQATVALERRNLDEADAGLRVAQASHNYTQVQLNNAVAARDAFADVRWELLEYAAAEAWAAAAAVDQDDEVRQTWTGHYYESSRKRRSVVLKELAYRRTRISHDLEAARLSREVVSVFAYASVTSAQVAQATARVRVAQQRVAIARLQARHAADNLEFVDHKELGERAWYEMARWLRGIAERYFDMAVAAAFLMERAYFLETGRDLRRIRFEAQGPGRGVLGGEMLAADIDSFTQDFLATTEARKAPIKQRRSFADEYPFAFDQLKRTGRCQFATSFEQLHRGYPGLWLAKLRNVEIVFVGITGASGIQGTLRTVGVSEHRDRLGNVMTLPAVPDVLPLSIFEARQDALLFRFDPNRLRVFENCGVVTQWQLELPLDANDFDLADLLDIHLVLYFDGFYDPGLEAPTRAALPAGGSASHAIPVSLYWPDELFYLRNQREARFTFEPERFPRFQTDLVRSRAILRLAGPPALVAGLVVRLISEELGAELTATTDAEGAIDSAAPGSPLAALVGRPVIDAWTLRIAAEDNPGRFPEGELGAPDLSGVYIVIEYDFTYRSAP
jgi:hypothetical protein